MIDFITVYSFVSVNRNNEISFLGEDISLSFLKKEMDALTKIYEDGLELMMVEEASNNVSFGRRFATIKSGFMCDLIITEKRLLKQYIIDNNIKVKEYA